MDTRIAIQELVIRALKNRAAIFDLVGEYDRAIGDYEKAKLCVGKDFQQKHLVLFAEIEVNRAAAIEQHRQNLSAVGAVESNLYFPHQFRSVDI